MVCFRYIFVNTLHKGDNRYYYDDDHDDKDDDDDDDDDNWTLPSFSCVWSNFTHVPR